MVWKDYLIYCEKNMVGKLLRLNLLIKKDLGGKLTKNQFGLMEKSMINVLDAINVLKFVLTKKIKKLN